MNDIKRIRDIQIVASKFLELSPELKVTQANSDVVDFYFETNIDKARCGVVVLDEDFIKSKSMDEFCIYIATKAHEPDVDGLPIIVASACGSDNKILFDFLLTWDFSECMINEELNLKELNVANYDILISEVRKQTSEISILNKENVRIIKTISLQNDRNGYACQAELKYARILTDTYQMRKFEPKSEKERYEHNLNGPYEQEYPSDLLDKSILEAVKTIYPNAVMRSKLLLCTSEYRSLLRYRNYQRDNAEIRFLPDVSKIPLNILPMLGPIEGLRIKLDILMLLRHPRNAYCNEGFELRFPMEGWLNTLKDLSVGLSNYEIVTKLIDK